MATDQLFSRSAPNREGLRDRTKKCRGCRSKGAWGVTGIGSVGGVGDANQGVAVGNARNVIIASPGMPGSWRVGSVSVPQNPQGQRNARNLFVVAPIAALQPAATYLQNPTLDGTIFIDSGNIIRKERPFSAYEFELATAGVDAHFNQSLCIHYARWTNKFIRAKLVTLSKSGFAISSRLTSTFPPLRPEEPN